MEEDVSRPGDSRLNKDLLGRLRGRIGHIYPLRRRIGHIYSVKKVESRGREGKT